MNHPKESSPHFESFERKASKYWTAEKLKKLTSGHKYPILPTNASVLLRHLGLMNADCSLSADSTRKFIQINHLYQLLEPHLKDLATRHPNLQLLDAGCGSSFLTFVLAWGFKTNWQSQAKIYGIDSNQKLIEKNIQASRILGYQDILRFKTSSIDQIDWKDVISSDFEGVSYPEKQLRPHAVLALHACDTATDDAIAFGIQNKSDLIAVAPCCQAELARKWKDLGASPLTHPLKPAFLSPHLRRELAAHMTDLMRVLILRGHGYEVTTTEFTMSHATPKNTLILAVRRGNYLKSAQEEYRDLATHLGECSIHLSEKVPFP